MEGGGAEEAEEEVGATAEIFPEIDIPREKGISFLLPFESNGKSLFIWVSFSVPARCVTVGCTREAQKAHTKDPNRLHILALLVGGSLLFGGPNSTF